MDENKELWHKCVEFHGHACGGLTIGYKASLYAIALLGLGLGGGGNAGCLSADEEVVCISENDACGVDAIQVILGCSIGKGNLLFHMRGKQAFTFFDRKSGKSLRLVLKPKPEGMTRQESFAYYQSCAPEDMFQVTEAKIQLPEKARIFKSITCECCGEQTAEYYTRNENGKIVCLDCVHPYNRFLLI